MLELLLHFHYYFHGEGIEMVLGDEKKIYLRCKIRELIQATAKTEIVQRVQLQ